MGAGRESRCVSCTASTRSNKQSSTCVACAEKIAKLTPLPSHVAPSGAGVPGHTRITLGLLGGTLWRRQGVRRSHGLGCSTLVGQRSGTSVYPVCAGQAMQACHDVME